jgi:hypothetical protein
VTENAVAAEAVVRELFFTPESRADPYPRYHRLRELAPVFRSDKLQAWPLRHLHGRRARIADSRKAAGIP